MKATIKDAKLMRINQAWKKHKPQGLGFSDNDVIIIRLETEDGNTFTKDFYCRLKGDGTLGHSITKRSEKRQTDLQNFIKRYISQDKRYNIQENISTWRGKNVEIEKVDNTFIIKL